MKNLQLPNFVLNSSLVLKNVNTVVEHSETELQELIEMHEGENGLIDSEGVKEDYYQVKVLLKSLNCSLTDACIYIGTLTNSEDPDESQYGAAYHQAYHQDLHCLLRIRLNEPIEREIHHNLENSTFDP